MKRWFNKGAYECNSGSDAGKSRRERTPSTGDAKTGLRLQATVSANNSVSEAASQPETAAAASSRKNHRRNKSSGNWTMLLGDTPAPSDTPKRVPVLSKEARPLSFFREISSEEDVQLAKNQQKAPKLKEIFPWASESTEDAQKANPITDKAEEIHSETDYSTMLIHNGAPASPVNAAARGRSSTSPGSLSADSRSCSTSSTSTSVFTSLTNLNVACGPGSASSSLAAHTSRRSPDPSSANVAVSVVMTDTSPVAGKEPITVADPIAAVAVSAALVGASVALVTADSPIVASDELMSGTGLSADPADLCMDTDVPAAAVTQPTIDKIATHELDKANDSLYESDNKPDSAAVDNSLLMEPHHESDSPNHNTPFIRGLLDVESKRSTDPSSVKSRRRRSASKRNSFPISMPDAMLEPAEELQCEILKITDIDTDESRVDQTFVLVDPAAVMTDGHKRKVSIRSFTGSLEETRSLSDTESEKYRLAEAAGETIIDSTPSLSEGSGSSAAQTESTHSLLVVPEDSNSRRHALSSSTTLNTRSFDEYSLSSKRSSRGSLLSTTFSNKSYSVNDLTSIERPTDFGTLDMKKMLGSFRMLDSIISEHAVPTTRKLQI